MSYPFIPARYFTAANRGAGQISWIVLHSMEAPEGSQTAENVANYFASGAVQASAHYNVDNNSIVQCVRDKDIAWAAPGANTNGLQIEQAGYARQTRAEWLDPYSDALLHLSAKLVREKCLEYGIPMEFVDATGLKAGRRGITMHRTVNEAFHLSTHTDPGAAFPMDIFLNYVRQGVTPSPVPGPVYGPITEDNVQGIKLSSVLDNEGKGYYDIGNMDKNRVVNPGVLNAADPVSSGGYKPIVEFAACQIGNATRIVFEGGIPGGKIDFTVWVTA